MGVLTLNWSRASDNRTPPADLFYRVYKSSSDDIRTVEETRSNGDLVASGFDIQTIQIAGLTPEALLYFNVLVSDLAGNTSAYTSTSAIVPNVVPEELLILDANFFMLSGTTRQINYIFDPGSLVGAVITWSSSNEAVATVDGNGVVTAIAEGEATITVRWDGVNVSQTSSVLVGVDLFDFGVYSETRTFTTINI